MPVQLVCQDNPGTATVSNTKNYASRCILRNLKLELRVSQCKHIHFSLIVSENLDHI